MQFVTKRIWGPTSQLLCALWFWLVSVGLALAVPEDPKHAPTLKLVFLADFNIPTGLPFESIDSRELHRKGDNQDRKRVLSIDEVLRNKASGDFGGISAIAYDRAGQRLLALSDTSKPVLFTFRIRLNEETLELIADSQLPLTDAQSVRLPQWSMDPEALALLPQGNLLIASEGYSVGIPRAGVAPANPALFEFDPSGQLKRSLSVPAKLIGLMNDTHGTHRNNGLESLTISPDGNRVFLAAEGSLRQDGPIPGLQHGSRIRIFDYFVESESLQLRHEYYYGIEAPPTPAGFRSPHGSRGLSELLALGEADLLALERSYVQETSGKHGPPRSEQRVEIYHVDLRAASDTTHIPSLIGEELRGCRPARKTLLLDLRDVIPELDPEYRSLDNFEGMCLGPQLADGSQTVLLVSDNNFNPSQRTVFLAFKLTVQ